MSGWDETYDRGTFLLNTGRDRVAITLWALETYDTPEFTSVAFYINIEDIPGVRLVDTSHNFDYNENETIEPSVTLWSKGHDWTPEDAGEDTAGWTDEDYAAWWDSGAFDLRELESDEVWDVVGADEAFGEIVGKVWTLDEVNAKLKEEHPDMILKFSPTQQSVEESEIDFDYTGLEEGVRRAFHNFHFMQDTASKYVAMRRGCEMADEDDPDQICDAMDSEQEFFSYTIDGLINFAQLDEDDMEDARNRLDEMVMEADWKQLYIMSVSSDVGPDKAFEKFWKPVDGSNYQRVWHRDDWERWNRRKHVSESEKPNIPRGTWFNILSDFYSFEGVAQLAGKWRINDDEGGLYQMQRNDRTGISFVNVYPSHLEKLWRDGKISVPGSKEVDYGALGESMTAYVAGYTEDQIRNVLEVCFAVGSAKEMRTVWENGGSRPGGFSGVFEPDGSDAFEETGTMNVYKCNYEQPNFDELIQTLPKVLDRLRVKYGTFRHENYSDRDAVRVVRVPITDLPLDVGPQEVQMSNTNFGVVMRALGFEPDYEGMTVEASDLYRRASVFKSDEPYLKRRAEELMDLADWATSNGYSQIYIA